MHWKQSDKIIEKTPEEKATIITAEMEKWIGATVARGGEAVASYNILSEPLAEQVDGNTFDWGAFMGETDYVRAAVQMARDTVSHNLNLYVSNTFALEDDVVAKADQLIALVSSFEDSKTVIDGYNILLNVKYSTDAATQLANETAISNMFKAFAATGKKVRISNFRIGVADAQSISADVRTAVAEYCAYILQSYLSQINPANQAGFSFAGLSGSGNEWLTPWNSSWNRTEMYEGIVNGLQ